MRSPLLIASLLAVVAIIAVAVVLGTGEEPLPTVVEDASAERGRVLIDAYGCGACHTIPGVPEADARIGPSLAGFSDERLIAGEYPNDTETLIRWLLEPEDLDPGTLMPDVGLTPQQARDIAAYLYSL